MDKNLHIRPKLHTSLLDNHLPVTAEQIIYYMNNHHYDIVEEILSTSFIDNDVYYNPKNIFNYLLNKLFYHTLDNCHKGTAFINFFLALINNVHFKFNTENIRNCIRFLPVFFPHHNIIIKKIKEQQFIDTLSSHDKTDLLLLLSEYHCHKNKRKNYQRYLSLFYDSDLRQCQSYFMHNFEIYFDNCYSSVTHSKHNRDIVLDLIQQVFFDKKYREIDPACLRVPEQNHILFGKDIQYMNLLHVLGLFHEQQQKVKYGYTCLFKNTPKFFIFFSKYIKRHHSCPQQNDIIEYFKTIEKKYHFSSISWDNRYFYGKTLEQIKNNIETTFNKALIFSQLHDFQSIHLQFSSPAIHDYFGLYWNAFNSCIHINSHIIIMYEQSNKDFESTFIHELTHFLHFQQVNSACFNHSSFKRLKNTLYLYKEKNNILDKLRKLLIYHPDNIVNDKLENVFNDFLYASFSIFNKKIQMIIKNKNIEKHIIDMLYSLFWEYKNYDYKQSEQFLLWLQKDKIYKLKTLYFNKNCEIHARMNEILSNNKSLINIDDAFLTKHSVNFDLIKKDLITFNAYLLKKYQASQLKS